MFSVNLLSWMWPPQRPSSEADAATANEVEQTTGPEASAHVAALRNLQGMLEGEENTFILVLDTLEDSTRRDLLQDEGSTQLMRRALELDQPRALLAVRRYATSERAPFGAFSDPDLVAHARTHNSPALIFDLYRRGKVSQADTADALAQTEVRVVMNFPRSNHIDRRVVRDVVLRDPSRFERRDLRQLRCDGTLDDAAYCVAVAPDPRNPEAAATLVEDQALGLISPVSLFFHLKPSAEQAIQWLKNEQISVELLLANCSDIETTQMHALYEQGYLTRTAYFESGRASASTVLGWIEDGTITCAEAARRYSLSAEAIEHFYLEGRMNARTYAANWKRGLTLPSGYLQDVNAAGLNEALRAVPVPGDIAARRSMLLWLCAERIEALEAAPVQSGLGGQAFYFLAGIAQRLGLSLGFGAVTAPSKIAPTDVCLACSEPFDDDAVGFNFDGCDHPPQFHLACSKLALEARSEEGLSLVCPVLGCEHPPTMAEAHLMGINPDSMDALARTKILGFTPKDWRACKSTGCVGGTVVPRDGIRAFHCAHCDVEAIIENRDAKARLRDVLIPMIEGMREDGTLRGCYHCGIATVRSAGCDQMTCGRDNDSAGVHVQAGCGQRWNFHGGRGSVSVNHGRTRQNYVPCRGDMVEAGLYEPLQPGSSLSREVRLPPGINSIEELVIHNAVKKGWLCHTSHGLLLLN